MDENGDDGAARAARTRTGSGKDLAAAGGLGVAVLGIMILGAFLRAHPPAGARAPGAPSIPPAKPLAAERSESAPSSRVHTIGEHAPPPIPPAVGQSGEPAAPLASEEPPARTPPSPSSASSPPSTDLETLALRARDDLARMVRLRIPYTAQLAVSCEPPNVERLLRKAGSSPSMYLLPAEVDGRSCWGSYASPREATAATDLPSVLREEVDRPVPKAVAEVLP